MSGNRYVPTIFTALDTNGAPIPSARLYFYENGTTTPKNTWSDIDLTVPNGPFVEADGAGRFTQDIFLEASDYRIKLTDASGVQIWLKDDCNTFNGTTSANAFPFEGAVIEFYGNQDQLDVATASLWYVMDGNNTLPNLNNTFTKSCITVGDIGGTGGSTLPTGTVESHILTTAEMPSHSHYNGIGDDTSGATEYNVYGITATGVPGLATSGLQAPSGAVPTRQGITSTTGSSSGHSHTLTMDTYNPPYYKLIKLVYLGY